MVKATDSWLACHEFEPSATGDPSCKGVMYVKSVEAQTSSCWCGVEVKRGMPVQASYLLLDHGSKLRSLPPKAFV
ncbi:hypothetical protein TNCV_1026971 [Trichonephila clavipes]|nr:hypothetical protein TNCV_1026971 [Trichonephila clavipes]